MKETTHDNSVRIRTELIFPKKNLESNKGNDMLINDVLYPLLQIINEYKITDCYNAWFDETDSFDTVHMKFKSIYATLDKNLYISHNVYLKVLRIIEEIEKFTCSCEGVDAIAKRYYELNPNLKYFCSPFWIHESLDEDTFDSLCEQDRLLFSPTEEEIWKKEEYFRIKYLDNEKYNFHHDEDDWMMKELCYSVRLMFMKEINN